MLYCLSQINIFFFFFFFFFSHDTSSSDKLIVNSETPDFQKMVMGIKLV